MAATRRYSNNVAAAVYGLILTGSILAASGITESAGEVLIFMILTLTLFWAAHVYSELLSDWTSTGVAPDRHRWADEMKRQWPMVGACAFPALALLAAAAGLFKDSTGIGIALAICAAELALSGFVAARRGGGGVIAGVVSAAVAFGFGVSLIVLKAILH